MDAFDPRPLRLATLLCVAFLALPGTTSGGLLLWTLAGGVVPLPLLSSSTHAMVQLSGGFLTLIWAFLAIGVPHLLGLDGARARRIVAPMLLLAAALALEVAGGLRGAPTLMLGARVVGSVATLAGLAVFAWARTLRERHLLETPLPFLVWALCAAPVAWALFALELRGVVPAGVAGDAMLFLVVVPVVMAMGWKMFSAMLQIDAGHGPRLVLAEVAWLLGGALTVAARMRPSLLGMAAPLLLVGAVSWLASLHGLRRRRRGLMLQATAGPELRVHVVAAVVCLLSTPVLLLVAAVGADGARLLWMDLARHALAVGFVLVITMGVTLRALPRFCRGVPSSAPLGLATLALLLLGLLLRAGRLVEGGGGAAQASAVLTLLAVWIWGAHLLRGVREASTAAS